MALLYTATECSEADSADQKPPASHPSGPLLPHMTFSTRPYLRRLQRRTTGVASQHRADETFKTFSLVSAEAVENASAEWKAALVAFDDTCPPLPIMWSNWREAKEWDRQRDEFVKLQRQTLEDAREHKSRLACLEGLASRPPTPGSPLAAALAALRESAQ